MRKRFGLLTACVLTLFSAFPTFGANGNVIYDGNAKQCIFEPGSEFSPTDLFPNFKDVMPGDSITQSITVRNDASNNVKVKIYMRSLGAHEESVDFLSQLHLRVAKSTENEMAYMFDASADETAQLTDWVCLGTLYSGGEVNLNVILDVPVELDNQYSSQIGYLDWEFRIEEFPIEPSDPKPPQTGDENNLMLWCALMLGSAGMICIFIWKNKKNKK